MGILELNDIKSILDENEEIDINYLRKRQFKCKIIEQTINRMEAEWLKDAVLIYDYMPLLSISFEHGFVNVNIQEIATVKTDFVLETVAGFVWNGIVTNYNREFIYYIPGERNYSLLCGNCEFLTFAYKCSFKNNLKNFEEYIDDKGLSKKERAFLKSKLDKYREFIKT